MYIHGSWDETKRLAIHNHNDQFARLRVLPERRFLSDVTRASWSGLCANEGSCSCIAWSMEVGVPDDTICALSKLFIDGISLVDDELLVEHFEHLAASEVPHLVGD